MNIDETPCFFDMPLTATIDFKGAKTVKVRPIGNEKLRFNVGLTVGVRKVDNQYKTITLPPMVNFQNLTKSSKGTFLKALREEP